MVIALDAADGGGTAGGGWLGGWVTGEEGRGAGREMMPLPVMLMVSISHHHTMHITTVHRHGLITHHNHHSP